MGKTESCQFKWGLNKNTASSYNNILIAHAWTRIINKYPENVLLNNYLIWLIMTETYGCLSAQCSINSALCINVNCYSIGWLWVAFRAEWFGCLTRTCMHQMPKSPYAIRDVRNTKSILIMSWCLILYGCLYPICSCARVHVRACGRVHIYVT